MSDPKNHDYLTREEAAAYLRVTPHTLYRWQRDGTGPRYRRVGRKYLYAMRDLLEFVEQDKAA